MWKRHNGPNQRWAIVYVKDAPEPKTKGLNKHFGFWVGRPFMIFSKMPMGRALEVVGGRNLAIKSRSNRKSQRFFFDGRTKTIQCVAHRGQSLDIANAGRASNLQIWKTNARWFQMFKLQGDLIVNERGKVLDVSAARDVEGQNVQVWGKHGGID